MFNIFLSMKRYLIYNKFFFINDLDPYPDPNPDPFF